MRSREPLVRGSLGSANTRSRASRRGSPLQRSSYTTKTGAQVRDRRNGVPCFKCVSTGWRGSEAMSRNSSFRGTGPVPFGLTASFLRVTLWPAKPEAKRGWKSFAAVPPFSTPRPRAQTLPRGRDAHHGLARTVEELPPEYLQALGAPVLAVGLFGTVRDFLEARTSTGGWIGTVRPPVSARTLRLRATWLHYALRTRGRGSSAASSSAWRGRSRESPTLLAS